MTEPSLPRPTDAELEILRVLWDQGPATVRQVMETLNRTKNTGYTTVLKLMQIMTEKGLVARDERQRTHIYEAAFSRGRTQRQLVGDLMARAFDNSAQSLVMQALSSREVSKQELVEIRKLLDRMEKERAR